MYGWAALVRDILLYAWLILGYVYTRVCAGTRVDDTSTGVTDERDW